jgi:hypothetical protein
MTLCLLLSPGWSFKLTTSVAIGQRPEHHPRLLSSYVLVVYTVTVTYRKVQIGQPIQLTILYTMTGLA